MFEFPIHAPIQQITYNVPKGYELFIKRDDLIDPLISGNKWRKLKFTLEKAASENKNTLVSFGGAYSNHLLALSSASAKFGFKSIAFVRGDEVQKESEMLTIARLLGMQVIRVSRTDYKDKTALFRSHFKDDKDAFFIDEGGMSEEGSLGCEDIINELEEKYTDIFLAAGTGCTTAGIINAIHKKQLSTHVHSVVVHQGTEEVVTNIERLTINEYNILDTRYTQPDTRYSILDTQGRYASTTPELLQFCLDFQRNTGILLDPIYTGKAMKKCYEWMNDKNTENRKVLFIHTGGILGNLGKLDSYRALLN